MRLFATLLVLLIAGLGWALWRGIDLASGRLAEATAEEPGTPVLDGVQLTASEQDSGSLEVTLEPTPHETGAAVSRPTQEPAAEALDETITPSTASKKTDTPSPEVIPGTIITTGQEPAPKAAPDAAVVDASPDRRRVTGDQVNLRQGPDVGTASLGLLSLDASVEVLEEEGDWLRVRTEGGEEGWVAAQFLGPSQG